LAAAHVLSVPILNSDKNLCLGSVDVLDLVAYVLNIGKDIPVNTASFQEEIVKRFEAPAQNVLSKDLFECDLTD
jgi:hypothetical protein